MTAEKKEAPEKKKEPFNVSEGGRKVLESMPAEMRDAFEGIITTADPTMRMMPALAILLAATTHDYRAPTGPRAPRGIQRDSSVGAAVFAKLNALPGRWKHAG